MSVAANMMMFNSSRIEREEREVYEKALKLLQRAAGISGETTDDIKNFVFDIYINGKVLSSLRAIHNIVFQMILLYYQIYGIKQTIK